MTPPLKVDPATLRAASTGFGDIASSFFNEGAGPAVKSAASGVSELDCGAACREAGDSLLAQAQVLGVRSNTFSDNLDSAAFAYQRGDEQAAEKIEFDTPGDGTGDKPGDDPNDPIDQYERELQDAGLLDGDAPPGSKYEEWLQNASANGIPPEEIVKIARDHHVTPESFNVLDGAERVTDKTDGKDYFLLPPGTNAETARRAALMTYVLNAGTGYGTARGNSGNDFEETPYSSAEVQRIIDRQEANAWSYDQIDDFVDSGGRVTTTPNGMIMGLGGDWPHDQLSQRAGSTYGDVFLVNIDNPADPAEQLRKIVNGGALYTYDAQGHLDQSSTDLDRTLHHEERHSQQWAQLGPVEFGKEYITAALNEQITGQRNPFETSAGAHDGGYE